MIKNRLFKSRIILPFALMAFMGLFFNSCQKEAIEAQPKVETESFEHTRVITAFDKSGENSADIVLTSNDLSLLNQYSAENFELIPVLENQDPAEAIADYYGWDGTENNDVEEDTEVVDEEDSTRPSMAIHVENLKKAPGVAGISITFKHPENPDARAWNYRTHTSYSDNVFIQRINAWHRVYFGLQYRSTSTSGYTTVVSRYRKLKNRESYVYGRSCYQLSLDVKYKNSSHYNHYFF